ncbi:MAG: ATP-binding cassette domain-containing protein [Jatrophihabitantaceae bacterium]
MSAPGRAATVPTPTPQPKQARTRRPALDRAASLRLGRRIGVPVVVTALVWAVVPGALNTYWLFVVTGGIIAIPIMASLGVITGRLGVMSLCQLSFAMIGAWACGWCSLHSVPGGFVVWLLIGGLAAVPAGLLIALPALRLRGVNLAIVTFVFAIMLDDVFSSKQFPGSDSFRLVPRPAGFTSDSSFFRFCVLVVLALFVLLALLDRTRLGASWLELRYSERGAAAHGTNVALSKLAAFAVSAFIAGVGGVLIVGQTGTTTSAPFTAQTSLVSFSIAVVIGVRFWESAAGAGIILALMPVLLDKINLSVNYVNITFGVLAVLILAKGKGQLGQSEIMRARQQAKRVRAMLGTARPQAPAGDQALDGRRRAPRPAANPAEPPALELRNVTVRFGAVTAVDDVSLTLAPRSVIALLGPNGAGKSTLIARASGFVPGAGDVLVAGKSIDRLPPHRRAQHGLRRSFQQLRVPPTLTVGQFLSTAAGRRLSGAETEEFLEWFGCPPAHVPIGTMDVGARRILEVAALTAGRPAVLLLDEPAAGQGARETELLGRCIAQIPERTGSTVLLVEHDIDLVRAACEELIVMDSGKVIASGRPDDVLADPRVVTAYLGGSGTGPEPSTDTKGQPS